MKKILKFLRRKDANKVDKTDKTNNNAKSDSIPIIESSNKDVDNKDNKQTSTNVTTIKNGKHLICDDSDSNRMVLSKYLTRKNYLVDEAINGQDAVEKIGANGEYFIVWMDIMMPRMNGLECTEQLRKKYNYKGVIIGLTGFIDQESVNECIKRGMNHVIGKPIDKVRLYHYAEMYTNNQSHQFNGMEQTDKKDQSEKNNNH